MALDGETILRFSADLPFPGHRLSRNAHMTMTERIGEGAGHGVGHMGITHPLSPTHGRNHIGATAHALGAAGHGGVDILVIFLFGGFSGRFGGYGYGYGHGGVGVIGILLIIVVVLLLTGRL